MVHDPQTGIYFWRYGAFSSPADVGAYINALKTGGAAVYVSPSGLYVFEFPGGLWLRIYNSRADNLDAAENASINEIRQGLTTFEGGFHRDYKAIDISKAIPPDFGCLPWHANCQLHLNAIVSIDKQANNWRLVLRNRWDQEVILDPSFKLVSTKQLTQPKQ